MKKIVSVLMVVLLLSVFVLPGFVFADGESEVASDEQAVLTTGEGSGDYTGGEVLFDDEGNVTGVVENGKEEPLASNNDNNNIVIICIAVAAVVVIGSGAAFIIYRKKKTAKADIKE